MRLAEHSLPKSKPEEYGGGENTVGLSFCPLDEGVECAQRRFGGKTLFVSDARSMHCFAPFARSLRAISVVFEADALPLFSMPDGVGSVFAAGGENTLKAARFFAYVRRIPCVLFPSEADLRGVLEDRAEILLCGKQTVLPLSQGELIFDVSLLTPSLAEAFASLLLARLALIEEHALRIFRRLEKHPLSEKMFLLTQSPQSDARDLVLRNFALQTFRKNGAPTGEGETLAALHKAAGDDFPVWRAFWELLALYTAFFECGKPRKYFVSDYEARARKAHTKYCEVRVPSVEEYRFRAATLEQMRGGFSAELQSLQLQREHFEDVFRALSGEEAPQTDFRRLKILPEHAPEGLSAIIRDFGLMEF